MGLVDFAIRRRVTIAMATVAITLLGMISLSRLKVNLLPDLSYPTLTIRTELPGAAPTEIENLISRPVEEAAGVVRNVRSVRSVSRSGQSDVIIEFTWGTDMDFAGIEVRERLDLLWLPIEATRPLLLRFDPSSEPVMRVAFVDETASLQRPGQAVTRTASSSCAASPTIASSRRSNRWKAPRRSRSAAASKTKCRSTSTSSASRSCGSPSNRWRKRIGAENVNLSGGRLEQGTQRFLVRTVNEFDTLDDMANSVIANVDGQPVYLKDVARVERGYKDRTAITRLNGDECIELAIYKEGDANTVQLAQGIRAKLEALEKTLPGGTKLVPVYDQSKFIASAVSDVKDAAILGGLLSILVLYFFLRDAWATIVTGIVIPVTVVGIFVMMYAFDLTLNVMSLGGIALSVGMLIDNSVVILEAIARRKEAGLSTIDAAREGTAEVATAVTASTLTSVAVFFPMVFVSGIAGQLFRDQALTVTFAQLISLMVGITLVPMLTAWRARLGDKEAGTRAPTPENRAKRSARCAVTCARASAISMSAHRAAARIHRRAPQAAFRQSSGGSWRPFAGCCACSAGCCVLHSPSSCACCASSSGCSASCSPCCSRRSSGSRRRATTSSTGTTPRCSTGRWTRRAAVLFTAFGLARGHRAHPAAARHRTDSAALAGRIHREDAPARGLAARDHRSRRCRSSTTRRAALPNLDSAYAVAGTGNRLDANPVDSGENTGNLDVKLRAPIDKEGEERGDAATAHAARRHSRRAVRIHAPVAAHARHARRSDPRRLRSRAPRCRRERRAHAHGSQRRVQGHPLEHRRRPSGNPDPVRPGARLATRAGGARHRGSRGFERARRRGHALSPAGKENRRAGAQRRYACGFHR